ncbi:hypothetical protein SO3561_09411 [Streptomyces olivochromogenes]|uniref:Uncharacterized protein n=1 Tax=Streptomyces olivochromogenes TaxID=1963 RepID=A0A250VUM8_STROL|nr:hypothetical protein SO3561_09411 [Streptomyces olivochromogenes]
MCPYWMASAIRPLGRRAMCQARVRLNQLMRMAPCGSAGTTCSGSPCASASWLTQTTKSSIRLFKVDFFNAPWWPRPCWKSWWAAL